MSFPDLGNLTDIFEVIEVGEGGAGLANFTAM
jgi:hypothetical protein